MSKTRVADVMTRGVEVVRSDCDVHELEKLLLQKKIHGAPVVDTENRLVGVVSQTDLLAWHYMVGVDGATFYDYTNLLIPGQGDFRGLKLSDVRTATVEELMSPLTYRIGPDATLAAAAAMMIKREIHRLVVVDESNVVLGIISAIDLMSVVPGAEEALAQLEQGPSSVPCR